MIRRNIFLYYCFVGVALCSTFLAACNSSDSGSSKPSIDASGTWYGQSSAGIEFTADIVQNGNNLGGKAVESNGDKGIIAGSIEGNAASWSIIWNDGHTSTYDSTIEGTNMSGTYEEIFDDQTQTGTFVATR